jgi:hypothetical protein
LEKSNIPKQKKRRPRHIIPRQERFAMSDIEVLEGKMKMPTR